ncbi:UDP-glycoslytransferase 3 [Artemisia annua]|uniref:Glycosyltransferase n=1 Tax=Artemisia annua TaxID=35608 RepID=A0A2U1LSF0_ARTAN|nr:UDP-glycoslytransferase 3 [Artemisia annua]
MEKHKVELFFIPSPLMGHAGQAVELARLLVNRFHHLAITVLVMELPSDPFGTSYTHSISDDDNDRIKFIHFPPMDPDLFTECPTVGFLADAVIEAHKPIITHKGGCSWSLVSLPTCSSLQTLLFLALCYIFTLHDEYGQDISELANSTTELTIPSYAAPVPPNVLPHVLLDKDTWFKRFIRYTRKYREAKGIIVNTFQELETHALNSYDDNTPTVYLVREIAIALERSGFRFIWSLRRPPSDDLKGFPGEYTDYNEVLPDGFLERTTGTGKVVGWVPQTEVLAHVAIGGFVSHCGWNSVLESLWYGVPIATWPMYAEQQLDAFQLVKELGLAVEISLDYNQLSKDQSLVSAADIEKGIREVMDTNSEVRSKVMEMKAKSRMALEEGGSSSACLRRLVDDLISYNYTDMIGYQFMYGTIRSTIASAFLQELNGATLILIMDFSSSAASNTDLQQQFAKTLVNQVHYSSKVIKLKWEMSKPLKISNLIVPFKIPITGTRYGCDD